MSAGSQGRAPASGAPATASPRRAEQYETWTEELAGWPVRLTCYRVEPDHYCHIDNVSPGATVARARGETRDAAIEKARNHARERLAHTRKVTP